jgi:hypothetical protein
MASLVCCPIRSGVGRRGRSSVGRAPQSHCGGQGFKSPRLHQLNLRRNLGLAVRGNRRKTPRPSVCHNAATAGDGFGEHSSSWKFLAGSGPPRWVLFAHTHIPQPGRCKAVGTAKGGRNGSRPPTSKHPHAPLNDPRKPIGAIPRHGYAAQARSQPRAIQATVLLRRRGCVSMGPRQGWRFAPPRYARLRP